ncbi:MAG: diacylglycerol kinase family lipid kinase [Bacteroidales bacterium]|nr:diacylglycerol kinase family lipid kinase [Bacteroidales bacterium]
MEKILYFLNPEAGSGIPEDLETGIREQSEGEGHTCKIHQLTGKIDPAQIEQLLDDYAPSITVAAGGDGTINLVAGAIMGRETRLGIIPLGSANGLAYQLNIPDDPMEALQLILSGKSRKVDMLMVNGKHPCLHMCDLGMNARVIRRYDKENVRGFYGYAKQYFREFGMRWKFSYSIRTDEKTISSKAVMIVLANGSYYGTGASISPEGSPNDGWFEVVAIHAYPFWFLFYMLLSVFFRKIGKRSFSRIIRCREARITVIPSQEMQVDGEPMGSQDTISARIIPGSIHIISGSRENPSLLPG